MFDGDECRAAAGYRLFTNFVSGRHLYIDDLVTADAWRSRGYGRLLNEYLVGLARKQEALRKYIDDHRWFLAEDWTDEVVAIERRRADVYDISVEETHRYAAQGCGFYQQQGGGGI